MAVGVAIHLMAAAVKQRDFHAPFLQRSTVITGSHHDADGACPGGLRDKTPGGGDGKQLTCTAVHVVG
ncbi:hypothetical protein JMUB7489_26870 [Staphylococcus aureus]